MGRRATGIGFASSHASDPSAAMAQIVAQLGDAPLAGMLLFCSHRFDRDALARAVNRHSEQVVAIGCTSSGELTDVGYDEDSLSIIGFPADAFHLISHCFDDIDAFDPVAARETIRSLAAVAERDSRHLGDKVNHVALFLVDGLSHREELLTMTIQDALGDIPLIGGSSGDGLAFRETAIFQGGRFRHRAAVIAILSTPRPLHVFKGQHYRPGAAKMVVTGAVPQDRIVTEINAEPAAQEYLRLAGHAGEALGLAFYAAHPPMVRAGGDYHVRSIQSANPDGSLTFYCAIDEGIVLTVGEPIDRIAGMEAMFIDIAARVGTVDRIVAFDCVLNRIDAEQRQISRAVSELYGRHRVIGFNTYGEQYHALHVNQTISGLAIGR
ncbi:FIST N-terminal domain-containing protein [Sphingobium sp. KCTC 72723]|uniref:FIST N-terminal domain-containing protein n=1 Tax=Sphingobium sp. KCTC 72723 TaxID=2733867 RepID=UPI00165D6A10|nr:FIST N-terminal domain-containing protein [Sphingobium sp. KCTC 72723]